MTPPNNSFAPSRNNFSAPKGFLCIFTLDRIEELRRFLKSFLKHNDLPISIYLARNTEDAHRAKTRCAFLTPYDRTCLIDIDIMVNGRLNDIFALVPDHKIGIVREIIHGCLNSGVVVFTTEPMKKVCEIWNKDYERKLIKGYSGKQGVWDQDLLIKILADCPSVFPYVELDKIYNFIVKDRTPEQELKIYDQVKVFHFMHADDYDRTKYKSYREFLKL